MRLNGATWNICQSATFAPSAQFPTADFGRARLLFKIELASFVSFLISLSVNDRLPFFPASSHMSLESENAVHQSLWGLKQFFPETLLDADCNIGKKMCIDSKFWFAGMSWEGESFRRERTDAMKKTKT